KLRLYERAGVSEYWLVDPALDVIRIYRRLDETFSRVVELKQEAGDVLTTPLLPGFEMPLADVFSE
ncbi:MAG TPA: Uma2 family endonuclease, partial [Vicinamibacterales bacterium]|nr:Uma2 family endonuclease [Vicinamibacterales bacterium]